MIALVFDTETTGFPSPKNPPEIVQIAAVLQDTETGLILGELNLLVQPSKPIPQACIDVHGITDERCAAYGFKPDIADHMFALMAAKADVIVAHNIKFDTDVINGVWQVSRAILKEKPQFCTMLKSTEIVGLAGTHAGGKKWPRLTQAYAHFFDGATFDGAHDAMNDVRACRDVYLKLLELEAGNV
jgi:DNA polymerase-3 subunit epsilon